MARHFEVFYCLEKGIRKLIAETVEAQHGEQWWTKCVPPTVKTNVQNNMQREIDSATTLRSEEEIDFTTFGELGEIVKSNWVSFDATFSSEKGLHENNDQFEHAARPNCSLLPLGTRRNC